ncbi:DUF3105 domain-containing protein [Frigoribacterium sp. 2-23]|uniref:DUF3105 domain-containing protein n=1 Tax=Frigoribacterium sp. 2-23 TaxID=3415006 RepID=UPI003C6EF3BD
MASSSNQNQPTVKQQRDARRQEKVAALQQQQKRSKRNRLIAIVTASVAGAAAIALVVTFVVTSGQPRQDPSAISIDGVKTYADLKPTHVSGTVDYEMTPPAGGPHNQVWMNCGVYSEQVPNENAVHDLEHGAIWFTYDPAQVSESEIEALRSFAPDTYSVVSPYPGLDKPMYVSAWGAQLGFTNVDADKSKLDDFVTKYWKSSTAPEPGAPCTGGIDGPGKIA